MELRKDDRTWLEVKQERKRLLADCSEKAAVLRQQIETSTQRISTLDARIQAQKQEYNHPLFHWILNRQLKKLDKQRKLVADMLTKLADLEQSSREFEQELEKPPVVRLSRTRTVYIPVKLLSFFLFISLLISLVYLLLLRQ